MLRRVDNYEKSPKCLGCKFPASPRSCQPNNLVLYFKEILPVLHASHPTIRRLVVITASQSSQLVGHRYVRRLGNFTEFAVLREVHQTLIISKHKLSVNQSHFQPQIEKMKVTKLILVATLSLSTMGSVVAVCQDNPVGWYDSDGRWTKCISTRTIV